mmetsp:Transcript_112666/g.313371  ORF Transcript_112666/g.313371 Transcript_112666/m.313371 type:complete len:256 (-) Transcript_112666:173-940(-)
MRQKALLTCWKVTPFVYMCTVKKICRTVGGTCSRLHWICSSSPSPAPVRLSPLCTNPQARSFPKKTVSTTEACSSKSTAETSRSTPWPSTSQPRPAVTLRRVLVSGRSTTPPFSMAKAAFTRLGAPGMTLRMRLPIVGSRTSMKCWPSCAGSSTTHSSQPPEPRTMAATTYTFCPLRSMPMRATSLALRSSRKWTTPFCTSQRRPPLWAATTKTSIRTGSGILARPAQMTSSWPARSPVRSSPECVRQRCAFMLL